MRCHKQDRKKIELDRKKTELDTEKTKWAPPAAGADDWFLLIFTVTPRYQVSGGYHSFHPSVGGSPTRRGA